MAAQTRTSLLGGSFSNFLTSHQFVGSLITMVVAFLTIMASTQAVVGVLDWLETPSNVDRRNDLEVWAIAAVAVVVIFIAGFVLRSFWWPALTAVPLFFLSLTTRGPYRSSMEDAFIGWMPRFFLIGAIVTALVGAGGVLIGRWADTDDSRRADGERWRTRLVVGLFLFTVAMAILAGASNAMNDDTNSRSTSYGPWIYGVSSNENMLVLGTGDGIVALDPATQVRLWHADTGAPVMLAPTVTEDRIYFGSHRGPIYAFDLNGNELWRYDVGNLVFRSPVVANGMVYAGSAAKFVALDSATGKPVWIIDLGTWVEISWSEVVDGTIYLGTAHGEILAVDATTGTEQWRFIIPTADALEATPGAFNPWIRNAPVVANGVIYFGCGDGNVYAVDAATGKQRWNLDTGRAGQPNVVVADNVVFAVTHDNAYALNAMDGTPIWHVNVNGGVWYRPVVTDELLIVAYDRVRGRLTGLDLATGETRWTYVYSEDPDTLYEFTDMHLRDGTLYAGSTGQGVFAIDAATGALRWRVLSP